MLKSYKEMREVDITRFCEDRDGKLYLNWAKCVDLLHENGAEKVYFEPIPDPRTGSSSRYTDVVFTDKNGVQNRCYETLIKVVIDDNEYYMQSPVMNGANPVKDNSMSQQRVWNSMCRSFVKCVAIHTGLGVDLWLKEEYEPMNAIPTDENQKATDAQNISRTIVECKWNLKSLMWLDMLHISRTIVECKFVILCLRYGSVLYK